MHGLAPSNSKPEALSRMLPSAREQSREPDRHQENVPSSIAGVRQEGPLAYASGPHGYTGGPRSTAVHLKEPTLCPKREHHWTTTATRSSTVRGSLSA